MAREAPSRQKTEEIKKQPSGEKETTFTRCSMNCSKAQGGTIHPSFFKIMLGNYEKTLAMPLKFRRVCGNLLGRIAQLQDSDGRSWAVEVSEVADRLAFRGGWDKFVSDHSIVFGEFLVFGYSGDLSFSVRIFGRSGCERRNFRQSEPERRSGSKRRASELFLVSHGDSGGNVSKSAASCSSEPEIADGGDRDCVNSSCEISSKEDDDVKKKKKQEMGANLSSNSSGQVGNKASAPNVHLDEVVVISDGEDEVEEDGEKPCSESKKKKVVSKLGQAENKASVAGSQQTSRSIRALNRRLMLQAMTNKANVSASQLPADVPTVNLKEQQLQSTDLIPHSVYQRRAQRYGTAT